MGKKDINTSTGSRRYLKYIVPLLIIIVTLVIYNPALKNGILHGWDDTEYLNDPGVQAIDLGQIFTNYHLGMYQPIAVFTLALNYGSAGIGPRAYHATNLFLHVINILLVWLFLFRLSRRKTLAGIGAFLFALHPLNVEPVAWIAARSTLLFTAFYLGGLIAYLKYSENKKPLYLALTILMAMLSLFSKSLAMSFPFVLMIIDYYQGRTWNLKLFLEKLPFLILSVIFGVVAIKAAETFGHITELAHDYSLADRFFILCHTYAFYFVKLLIPIELSSIYSYPDMSGGGLPLMYYLSVIIPLALIYLIYRFWNKQKEVIAGLLFFSIAIAPVLPLFWSRIFVAADRYAYLSFIGLFLIAGILIDRLLSRNFIKQMYLRYSFAGLLVVYGIFLAYGTSKQIPYWTSAETLLSRAISLSESGPARSLAYFYRGNIYQNIAEQKMIEGYQTRNEGMIKNSRIYYRDVIIDYDSTLAYNPKYMLAYANRGMAYVSVAQFDTTYLKKYLDRAEEDFNAAIDLDPEYADNYYNKGWLFYKKGDIAGACELWRKADELGSVVAFQPLQQYCK